MPFLNERIRVETREVSPTRGSLSVGQDRQVLPFFEIGRSQTTDIGVLRNRDAGCLSYKGLQVRKDLHVYRKTCHTPDKVRKDLNGAVQSLGNGFFPIPPCSARVPGFAFFEIWRSQTTDIGVLRECLSLALRFPSVFAEGCDYKACFTLLGIGRLLLLFHAAKRASCLFSILCLQK